MNCVAGSLAARLSVAVRLIENFPAAGVRFLDIGPAIADATLLAEMIDALAAAFGNRGVTHVLGLEARGLYFAGAVAVRLGAGLVPVRKPGKLPPPTTSARGAIRNTDQVAGLAPLEAGRATTYQKPYQFEIAAGVIGPGARVLMVDDLLAKGGSAHACRQLVAMAGAELIGAAFVIELSGLGGRETLEGVAVDALMRV